MRSARPSDMKVLLLTTLYAPDIGANARIMTELAHDLRDAGHAVTVITTHPHYTAGTAVAPESQARLSVEELEGIEVVRVGTYLPRNRTLLTRALSFVSFMFAAPRAVRRLRLACDAIVAICPPLTTGFSAYLAGRRTKAPYVFYIQDLYPDTAIELGYLRHPVVVRLARAFADFVHQRARRIAVISEGFREDLALRGIGRERVSIVPNWVDVERFRPAAGDGTSVRRELGLEGKFVVLFAGTMGLAQGLESVLCDALEALEGHPEIVFVMLGGGLRRPALEEACRERGLTSVRFVDPQPHDRMPGYLAAADAYLVHLRDIPLYRVTIPSKTYEYMAMGRPLLMGVGGEAAELVRRSGAGLSFAPENGKALADAVLRLAADPSGRSEMGARARDHAVRNYARRTVTGAFIREIETMALVPAGETVS